MLKAIRVSAMLLALVGPTYAGEVLTPPAPQPIKPGTGHGVTFNDMMSTPDASESLTQITLELLAVLPSIL